MNNLKIIGSASLPTKCILFMLILTLSVNHTHAQSGMAAIPGDFADPSIIKHGATYYATGTSSEWAPHFPVFKSADLLHWTQSGYIFKKTPAWTASSFWAPEYFFHNNTYFIYYTAKRKKDGISCIGVATSKYPDKDFEDHGIVVEYGKEAIDGFIYNDNGQLYITWKAYGLDKRPIEILGSKLSADGLSLVGEPFSLLKDDQRIGLEGQSILKKGAYYYLFYSAGNCCGLKCDYNLRVARSKNLQGPYDIYAGNPILQANAIWKCPGHGSFVTSAEGRYYYLHHAYSVQSNVFTGREGLITELLWPSANDWPVFKETSDKIENAARPGVNDILDKFTGKTNSTFWQWDFRNAEPIYQQQKNGLHLSGTIKHENKAGVALTVRPYSAHFELSTAVVNNNHALKGLVIYGDANAAIGIGTTDNRVEYWVIKNNERTLLGSAMIGDRSTPVNLKMMVSPDFTCRAYWKQNGEWQEIIYEKTAYNIDFLPPWDRSPRPGLIFKGNKNEDAVFSFFALNYIE